MNTTNRRLKFRAWHKESKILIQPIDLEYVTGFFTDEGYIIQQFTDLQDKNEKEIYEGDIIKFTVNKSNNYEIFYYNGAFLFKVDDGSILPIYFANKETIEVIGNIYENPNLLLDNSNPLI